MHIIGGGIIGLCCAWYLKRAGFDVTVVDMTDMQDGCSFGNSGIIVPSHSAPLASPGVVSQGLRWMLNPGSPFFIRPRFDPALWQWMWHFMRSCTPEHVEKATPVLRDFHLLSKSLYQEFAALPDFSFAFEQRGSLMLFRTAEGKHEELKAAERALALGLRVSEMTSSEVDAVNPDIRTDVLGDVFYEDDAHLHPGRFVLQLQAALKNAGVQFLRDQEVIGFVTSGSKVTHLRFKNEPSVAVENVILATGAWSGRFAKKLGLRLPIQDGKGYSITLRDLASRPALPSILTEARVAVTPMGNDLRIGGTLEVSHFDTKINKKRVAAILRAMTQYYPGFPELDVDTLDVWHGFRPVSADGMPFIGRPRAYTNLVVAAGHAMLGMSLGPGTGLLVSEIAQDRKASLLLGMFDPDRF